MTREMQNSIVVCKTTDVPVGGARKFLVKEKSIGVYNIAGEFFALDDPCPHGGASLAHGIVEGLVVRCRMHHWRFCVRTGRYLDEDKANFDVKSYRVRTVGDQLIVELGIQ